MNQDYKVNTNSSEAKRREEEIAVLRRNLTDFEIFDATMIYARTKWQRLRNENSDFKAETEKLNISGNKVEK